MTKGRSEEKQEGEGKGAVRHRASWRIRPPSL